MPMNGNGIEFLLAETAKNSVQFLAAQESRRRYRQTHDTEISVLKCMDGRLNGSVYTGTPLGILQPFRNLGGRFHLGWPHFRDVIHERKNYADRSRRDSLVLATYHFARGSKHRGCAGFNCNAEAAQNFSLGLKLEFDEVFGDSVTPDGKRLHTIQVGMETDWESLILHGENGECIDLADFAGQKQFKQDDVVRSLLVKLYPKILDASPSVIRDLTPLVKNNIWHSAKMRAEDRDLRDLGHREWVLAIGQGFDGLHLPNTALIVGPWEDLTNPIAKAAGLIVNNLREGMLGDGKVVLWTSGVHNGPGERQRSARLKSLYLKKTALDIIGEDFKELAPRLQVLVTTTDLDTRQLTVIEPPQ